jgi:phage recombination protein Bet
MARVGLAGEVTPEQVDLIKRTVAKGATNDELNLYLFDCKRRGVHPLDKLIIFTKRKNDRTGEYTYTPVTTVDFMRSRAADTGEHAGTDDAEYIETNTYPAKATVRVYRFVNGERCGFQASARWKEYYPGDGAPGFMWRRMPYLMLGKCAEALALRRAFPQELGGLYVSEEMDQAGPVLSNEPELTETRATQRKPSHSEPAINCERCKGQITETTATKNGQTRTVSVRDLTNRSKEMWGKNICADCQRAIARGASVEPPKDDPPQQQQSAAPAFETKTEHIPDSGGLVEVVGIPVKFEGLEVGNRKKLVVTMSDGYGLQTWHVGDTTQRRLKIAISRGEPTLFSCQETEKGGTKYLDMKDVIRVGDKTIEQLELNTTLVP